jgi:nucleoside-diphosphate-sugar epimerase
MVNILALPSVTARGLIPSEVKNYLHDFDDLNDDEVRALVSGHDAVVFAAGADYRVAPKAPAYPFFQRYNVAATRRAAELSRQSGVQRFIILGSYFVY